MAGEEWKDLSDQRIKNILHNLTEFSLRVAVILCWLLNPDMLCDDARER